MNDGHLPAVVEKNIFYIMQIQWNESIDTFFVMDNCTSKFLAQMSGHYSQKLLCLLFAVDFLMLMI